jgi:superfamily II DNA or RNA helicase
MIELWKHQKEAIEASKNFDKCLINIWCGCGKTRIIVSKILSNDLNLSIVVFPSLGLINQFNNDYILKKEWKEFFKYFTFMSFCSDSERKLKIKTDTISYTTDNHKLLKFLNLKNKKLLSVTYHSFEKFVNVVTQNNIHIDQLFYDEAHHIVGESIQEIVFRNNELDNLVKKTEFYTATPINNNDIIMYDRDNPESSDCGPLAYEYLYYKAVEDKICKPFETTITLFKKHFDEKTKEFGKEISIDYLHIFENIIRCCFSGKYDYYNILTFHSFVNESEK